MPLRMFKLKPGEKALYRVSVPARETAAPLYLEAIRPAEGLSVELELRLLSAQGDLRSHGRAQLADGYLAVISEVERQLRREFDNCTGELWFELNLETAIERSELQMRAN